VKLETKAELQNEAGKHTVRLKLKNPSKTVAFQVIARLTKNKNGDDLVPIFWDDNYFSLLPGEEKTITATFSNESLGKSAPVLEIDGFNLTPETISLPRK